MARIVVAGDVTIDWLAYSVPAVEPSENAPRPPPNYQLHGGTRMVARGGGALLFARQGRSRCGRIWLE